MNQLREQLMTDIRDFHVPVARRTSQEQLNTAFDLIHRLATGLPVKVSGSILEGSLHRLRDVRPGAAKEVITVQRLPLDTMYRVSPEGEYTALAAQQVDSSTQA